MISSHNILNLRKASQLKDLREINTMTLRERNEICIREITVGTLVYHAREHYHLGIVVSKIKNLWNDRVYNCHVLWSKL